MSAVVGAPGAVKGRLPHGWRIVAHFDKVSGVLKLTSSDTDDFVILVDTNNMHEYGAEHERSSAKLGGDSYVEAKYDDESGILRFDSKTYLEFWIEVKVKSLRGASCKRRKTSTSSDDDEGEGIMKWSNMKVDDAVLTLWLGTLVREADLYGPKSIHIFFKKIFDIAVTPVGCVTTLPDKDDDGVNVEGTGGRHDFFFFVKAADVPKFAVKRFEFGMRWWSDVYFNNHEDIYPVEFLNAYPNSPLID